MHGKGKYFIPDKPENPASVDKNLSTFFGNFRIINLQKMNKL